ncbi:unnamed protein product [Rotaria sp. Silwood2]|nr:unnamed protein product [Rotaria sp. Silwood2]
MQLVIRIARRQNENNTFVGDPSPPTIPSNYFTGVDAATKKRSLQQQQSNTVTPVNYLPPDDDGKCVILSSYST